jgi:hypothetical protein
LNIFFTFLWSVSSRSQASFSVRVAMEFLQLSGSR